MSSIPEVITEPQITDDVLPNVSAIALRRSAAPSQSLEHTLQLGEVFTKSGFFQDVKSVSQAAVKIMAGEELGFGPFASMRGIYIINGRTAMEANLMAQGIKRSGRYDYRVTDLSDAGCSIDFLQRNGSGWEKIGTSAFSREDAKRAGTKNMEKFPRNMLFARALSNGARWFCPDAFASPVYIPEELGMEQRQDGTYREPDPMTPPAISEPRRKSEAKPAAPEPVIDVEPDEPEATPEPDGSRQYHIAGVQPGPSPNRILVLTTTEETFLADPRLRIVAKSAMQSKAAVILTFAMVGDEWCVTAIEELEG